MELSMWDKGGAGWFLAKNNSSAAGLLAIKDEIAGLRPHKELDAALRALKVFRSGPPNQLAVTVHPKDIEGRDHGGLNHKP